MKPTFDSTVAVLVKAYLNDTLEHGNCSACAVGNLIADACRYKYVVQRNGCARWKWKDGQLPEWYNLDESTEKAVVYDCDQTRATGYSNKELERIEHAFESTACRRGDNMFYGLMEVLEVLASIHNVDLSQKEEAKKLFVKC